MTSKAGKITSMLLLAAALSLHVATCLACAPKAIPITPGVSIQDAVDKAGDNASLCLKTGVHRVQVVRPLRGQTFQGEEGATMNGARVLSGFRKEGAAWTVLNETRYERRAGQCAKGFDTCNFPKRVFIDNEPLRRVLSKSDLRPGFFFVDSKQGKLFIATIRKERQLRRASRASLSRVSRPTYR